MPRSFFSVVAKEALGAKPASEHVAAEIINAGMAQSADEVVTLPDGTIYAYQACPKQRNGKVPDVPGIYIFVGRMMNGSRPAKRAAFNKTSRTALEEYKATGQHVTGEETSSWLETWGTGDEIAPPKCHK